MPTLTTELFLNEYEWSHEVPSTLADRLNPVTFSRSIDRFNFAYRVRAMYYAFWCIASLSVILMGIAMIIIGNEPSSPNVFESAMTCFWIGLGFLVLSMIWKFASPELLRKRLIHAMAIENIDPREWRRTPHASSTISVYWSLTSREVIAHSQYSSIGEEVEEPVIICEVTYQIDEVQEALSLAVPEVEGENPFENGNRTEGVSDVMIDVHEHADPTAAASTLLALANPSASASVPPLVPVSVPHDQYVRQLQILNGER